MIVVGGESLFDLFVSGRTELGLALDARMGGSSFNVAIGLARLGQKVSFAGAIAGDVAGSRLMDALREEGVDASCTARVDAPTSLMLVGLDDRGVPAYTFLGEHGADRRLVPSHLEAVPESASAYHVGSYSMVVEPAGSTLRMLVEREADRSVVSYDPNVRLRVESDLGRWRNALQWMLPRTRLLKISMEDLQTLFPGRSRADFAADALSAGAALVVITGGSEDASGFTRRASEVRVPAVPVKVEDTVGAGDAFQAALLAWLSENGELSAEALEGLGAEELRSALGFACRAAAIACTRRGADMPRRKELGGTA